MSEVYFCPSRGICGVHVIRYYCGRLTMASGFGLGARLTLWSLLTNDERERLVAWAGVVEVETWLTAAEMSPRDVPLALRVPGYSYDEDYWITPLPEFGYLLASYPYETPPPPRSAVRLPQ
jgi:hypothetical protein